MMGFFGANHEASDGKSHNGPIGCTWTDIWGTVWRKEQEGIIGFPVAFPISSPEALRSYRWPDTVNDAHLIEPIYATAKAFVNPTDAFLGGSHRNTLWERACQLVGMESLMDYFYSEPGFIRDLFHSITDFHLGIAHHYLKLGVEMIHCSDDLGTQHGPLIGPDLLNEFFVPEYHRLFDLYRQQNVLINFHSCGNIESVIPTFTELGIHILNPVQTTANDLDKVRRLTQGKIALQGGVSSGTILSGPIETIIAETRQRIRQLGADGGYFCAPDQYMPWPQAHIDALFHTVETYGRYPLTDGEPS